MPQPSIIVIMADDQDDYDLWRFMPKLKRLFHRNGLRFRNCFIDRPLCTPSLLQRIVGVAGDMPSGGTVALNGFVIFSA
jgi:hypothetical protein